MQPEEGSSGAPVKLMIENHVPGGERENGRRWGYLLAAILCVSTFALYWRVLKYSYVQDDWIIIRSIVTSGSMRVIRDSFFQIGALFYRPLGTATMVAVYSLFGPDGVGFHILGLLIHCGNSLLVALIIQRITRDQVVSWTSAFLYMAAASVHIDPLMWMVGIYDLGATFFFLLSIYLFSGGRSWASVVTFVLALLMKDSAIVLPAVLFMLLLLDGQGERMRIVHIPRKLPHAVVALLYLIVRSGGLIKLFGAEHRLYTTSLGAGQRLSTLSQYLQWSVGAVIWPATNSIIALLLLVAVILFALHYFRRTNSRFGILLFFAGWFLAGLIPPMLIASHTYRYYLSASLPAFLVIFVYGVCGLTMMFEIKSKVVTAVMAAIVAVVCYSSTNVISTFEGLSSDSVRMAGSNNLMMKGSFVEPVHAYLLRSFKSLRPRTTFIFDGIPAGAFGGSAGPRIWLGDSTLQVLETIHEPTHLYLTDPMDPDPSGRDSIAFDPRNTYVIIPERGELASFRLIDRYSSNPFSNR